MGLDTLSRWNVAAADRILLQIQSAELQGDRDALGRTLRDAEALRARFLTQPTASADIVFNYVDKPKCSVQLSGSKLSERFPADAILLRLVAQDGCS